MRKDVLEIGFGAIAAEHHFLDDSRLRFVDEIEVGVCGPTFAHVDAVFAVGLFADDAVFVGGDFRNRRELAIFNGFVYTLGE